LVFSYFSLYVRKIHFWWSFMKLSFLFSFVDEFTKERKNVLKDPWRSSYCTRVVSGGNQNTWTREVWWGRTETLLPLPLHIIVQYSFKLRFVVIKNTRSSHTVEVPTVCVNFIHGR
jgi:hypothetical protein